MRTPHLIIAFGLLATALLSGVTSQAQSYDKELTELAASVSKYLQTDGRKKATVLDFMDLQGNVNELGRFLAEEFSVALVMNRKGFAVVDRANLKTILAEHKLSLSGLVEPKNAKQLGEFSGVDAIILGTITALKDDVIISVKIIATDTAEIVGVARGKISKSKDIENLLERGIAGVAPVPQKGGSAGESSNPSKVSDDKRQFQEFDGLSATIDSFRLQGSEVHRGRGGTLGGLLGENVLVLTVVFKNLNQKKPVYVGLKFDPFNKSNQRINNPDINLSDSDGKQYRPESNIIGINALRFTDKFPGINSFTKIEAGGSIRAILRFPVQTVKAEYRLQAKIPTITEDERGEQRNKLNDLLIEHITRQP